MYSNGTFGFLCLSNAPQLKYYYCLFCLCASGLLTGQQLRVSPAELGFDRERELLLVHYDGPQMERSLTQVRADTLTFSLPTPLPKIRFDTSYTALSAAGDTLVLWFTRLPLVKLVRPDTLSNETRALSKFSYADSVQTLRSSIGIRQRGNYSLRFPKQSFDLEFWEDAGERQTRDVSFGELRVDDDWVLDALYNEPMRVNSYVAHKLWLDLHAPYYRDREQQARSGADVLLVELFYGGSYYGVYMLSEQVDRKQLKLKKFKGGAIRGELYKGLQGTAASRLGNQPALPTTDTLVYGGWEWKYPDEQDTVDWSALHRLLGFAANSSEPVFAAGVETSFQLDNLIDYLLYVNATSMTDNMSKNVYLARYREYEPYFYVPWDLDGAFGNNYRGVRQEKTDLWLSNHLFSRLVDENPGGFLTSLCDRYESLRTTLLATDALQERLDEAYHLLLDNGVYAREQARWGNARFDQNQVDFTRNFVRDRMAHLDSYVCGLATSTRLVMVSPAVVFPNPANQELTVRHRFTTPVGYRLYGVQGQPVGSGILAPLEHQLSVAGLPPGVYLLRFADRVARFVVQH